VQPLNDANRFLHSRNGRNDTHEFTDIFIKRPVLATVVSLLILVLGLRSINLLPVREYPKTQNAGGKCHHRLYRADSGPGVRLHHHTAGKLHCPGNGIDYLTSSSSQSVSTITANMRLNYDANTALAEINTKVNAVLNSCPRNRSNR